MNNYEEKRMQKIFEILVTIKVIYILLSIVAILSSNSVKITSNAINTIIYFVVAMMFIFIYFLWLAKYSKITSDDKPDKKNLIEILVLLTVFILVLIFTDFHKSPYKFMSIFIILIGSIQFGKKYSLWISVFCAGIILFTDIIANSSRESLSFYFEMDLVLIGALMVTAFILGMYVDIEKEHGDELKTLVNIDELTGLYNHRYFQDYLTNALNESDKTGKEVSLLFMDIDYFKNYNDINGHQAGDWLLKEVGRILKESIREQDIVARYGGEEFAAVLPDTKEEFAITVGERIRKAIENNHFYGQENQPDKNITISIGVSSYPNRAKTKHQLINTADDALYRAKSFNKNRVETYENVLECICSHMDVKDETVKSLKAFISMINKKDRYTYAHTERVVIYTNWFAEYLELEEEEKIQLKMAAYLHDIGKIEVPEEVLNKKDRLTDHEFSLLKQHPVAGVDLIQHIEQFKPFIPIIKHHHERYDGRGYPDGLKGKEIPYLARVLTIADSFDAMTSNRPYNNRKNHEDGINELRANAGTQFDSELVESFIKMLDLFKNNF